jgi:DNA polymerase-3 subunit delta
MDALAYIERSSKTKPALLFVLCGDEDFLVRRARAKLVADLLGDADPAFAVTAVEGEKADWRAIKSELDTLPFLSPRRVVVVEQADVFVTNNRPPLEEFAAAGASRGTLILEVKTWPGNTRLAKMTPEACTIVCKSPADGKLVPWCKKFAADEYGKSFAADAAPWLVELVGASLGQLAQEIEKLAIAAGDSGVITRALVDSLVGRTRQAETFKIFDAIGAGRSADAIAILHRLYQQGEDPMAVLGAFSWQLRRLGAVSRSTRAGRSIPEAMDRSGVPPFARAGVEQQLRHLGRRRMDLVYDWLIDVDLGMKGSSELPPRMQLERLVVRLAAPAQ